MEARGDGQSLCHEAGEYYYDLLCHDAAVPETVARHVEHCPFCLEQIRRLHDAFSKAGDRTDPSRRPDSEGAVEALGRQFEFLDERVGCSQAKPFLPDLLIPSRRIRVATPITVHIEHCPQCAKDLASIRELDLTADQLGRLSLFYGQSDGRDRSHCGRARSAAAALAAFSFEGADPEALDHVAHCPQCRARVRRHRAHALAGLPAGPGGGGILACDDVSMADVFDCIAPFGLDAAAIDKADGRRDAVVTHLRACRPCLEKAQSLHQTIYTIAERADSHIQTTYRSAEDAEDVCEQTQAPGYRYPVSVQVLDCRTAPAAGDDESAAACDGSERWALAGSRAKLPFKTAFAAAAAVVVALLLLANAPTATGMHVGDIFMAVERAANVHIVNRRGDRPQPSYEMWVAKDRGIFALRTGAECTVYDLGQRDMRVIHPDLGPGEPVALKPHEFDRCRLFVSQAMGNVFADASPDGKLSRVDDDPSDRPGASLSVYELTRADHSSGGAVVLHQWRVSIDPALQLPVKIEHSRRDSPELEWEPVEVTVFRYPGGPDMENEIKALLRAP